MNMILTRAPGVGAPVPLELDPLDLDPLALDPDALDAMPIDVLIRAVIARASALTPDADPLLDVTVDGVRCALTPVHPSRADTLSPREREIARMVAQGYTNKMIASVLDISLWTVSTHLRRIFAKLGVSTRAAMVALVVERQP
jgi:DNA-binding CsgD family transcriptional regulator